MANVKADFPAKLNFLFDRHRYKVARGGRGSGKSWGFARALLIQGMQRQIRVLCAREVQLSIKQSVHKLLKDQIELLGIGGFYTITDTMISGRNGTEFSFTGLSTLTVDSIKSFEGTDVCWVEEGQVISKRSWDILIPTIRKTLSEIWISYNPDLETDETHQRFTITPPENCVNVEMNWRDNPWFNEVLEAERQHSKANSPDDYNNIWEGKCRSAVEGAIYNKQVQEAENNNRICNVPYDPMLKVHIVPDLGWEDSLTAALVQVHLTEIRIIEYLEFNHTGLDAWSNELQKRPYNWGRVWLPPADGFSASLKSKGKSVADILNALDWDVVPKEEVVELSVDQGIRNARMNFHRLYFDKNLTAAAKPIQNDHDDHVSHTEYSHRLLECLRRYRRHINKQTGAPMTPARDAVAHGADTLRYITNNADQMVNEAVAAVYEPKTPKYHGNSSWMI